MHYSLAKTVETTAFRLARPEDLDGLVELFQCFFAETDLPSFGLRYDFANARQTVADDMRRTVVLVAVDSESGRIVGSIGFAYNRSFDKPVAEMGRFYVKQEWRRSAIGHTLLMLAIDTAKAEGAAVFRAFVNSGVSGGGNIFKRFGFRETPHSFLFGKEL